MNAGSARIFFAKEKQKKGKKLPLSSKVRLSIAD